MLHRKRSHSSLLCFSSRLLMGRKAAGQQNAERVKFIVDFRKWFIIMSDTKCIISAIARFSHLCLTITVLFCSMFFSKNMEFVKSRREFSNQDQFHLVSFFCCLCKLCFWIRKDQVSILQRQVLQHLTAAMYVFLHNYEISFRDPLLPAVIIGIKSTLCKDSSFNIKKIDKMQQSSLQVNLLHSDL